MRKYQQSPYHLIKFMLFISIHKIEGRYWKYEREIFWGKRQKMKLFIPHFMSSEELISTDQSVQMYLTVFGFCQTLIFNVTFQGKYFSKNNLLYDKNLLTSQDLFSQFCHFWRYFRDKMLSVQRIWCFKNNTAAEVLHSKVLLRSNML